VPRATGPINLTDYSDQITADNFYGKAFYYTQNRFFPGSTQKKDFLGSLLTAILLRISQGSVNQALLFKAVETALSTRTVELYFAKPQIEELAQESDWTGSGVSSEACVGVKNPQTCFGDFVGMVEANLSVNKVNYFIKRNWFTQIDFSPDGTVSNSTLVEFNNNSEGKNGDGGGVYRNYERFYVPQNTDITQISINGQNIPLRNPNSVISLDVPYAEYDTSSPESSQGAKILGMVFDVKPREKISVMFAYTNHIPSDIISAPWVYEFNEPVQPGVGDITGKTFIRLPQAWSVVPLTPPLKTDMLANQVQLEYNTDLTGTNKIRITIEKK
jgi:hypothetical protein